MTYPLEISENHRYLQGQDKQPFFWLADTAWELLHRLSREEIREYLDLRRQQGFNTVQTVLLAEMDGLETPNFYRRRPLLKNALGNYDPSLPDLKGENSYWDLADFLMEQALERDMLVALLPTWGDKWNKKFPSAKGPEVFTPENAYLYGEFLSRRYNRFPNLVYILGGDRTVDTPVQMEILHQLAAGLKRHDSNRLITFHPMGPGSSYDFIGQPQWLSFHMLQTGHFDDRDQLPHDGAGLPGHRGLPHPRAGRRAPI